MKTIVIGILSGFLFACWITGVLYEFGITYEQHELLVEKSEINVDN